jgi:MFS family permease
MRAVLAVVLAFIALSVLVFALSLAPWLALGNDVILEPGRFDSTMAYTVYAVVVAGLGGVFGGWLCATIGRSRAAVLVLAVLCLGVGLTNHFAQHHKAEPGSRPAGLSVMDAMAQRREPDWFTLLVPVLGAAGIVVGGRLRL